MVGVQRFIGMVRRAVEPRQGERRLLVRRQTVMPVGQERRSGVERRLRDRRSGD